jgi:hypothetical protein
MELNRRLEYLLCYISAIHNKNGSPVVDIFKVEVDGLSTLNFFAHVKVYAGLLFTLKIVIKHFTETIVISDSIVKAALTIAENSQNFAFISIFDQRSKLKLEQKLLQERYVAVGQLIRSLDVKQTKEWFKSEQNMEDFSLSIRTNGDNVMEAFFYRLGLLNRDLEIKGFMRYLIEGLQTDEIREDSEIKKMIEFLSNSVCDSFRVNNEKQYLININKPDTVDGMSVIHDISKAEWMKPSQLNLILTTLHSQRNGPDLSVRTINTYKTPLQLAEECNNVAFLKFYGIGGKAITGNEYTRFKRMMLDTLERIDKLMQKSKQPLTNIDDIIRDSKQLCR